MLDKSKPSDTRAGDTAGPPRDFQEHLARLEARGLVTRIDRPINKDTELHPLARWQFQGGLPENERRAFLFTNVVDSAGHRYDMPVVVGALAASAEIYAAGMGRPVDQIGTAWTEAYDGLLAITRQTRLLERHPALEVSIRLRLPYIEPLNLLQVEMLKRHRAGEKDARLREGIHLSINAIATALRNSG